MFPANPTHCQSELFGSQTLLSKGKQQKLKESKQAVFYELIFRQISEDEFAVLYSGRDSRPIDPVNTLAAALILKHRHSWSYKELFEHIEFRSGAPVVFYPRRRRPPHTRWRGWQGLPDERRTLRANVEATVGEMKGAMEGGKLPVRGGFAAHCHGLLRSAGRWMISFRQYVKNC